MTRHDASTLMRELRPQTDATPDEDALERLLLEPSAAEPALPRRAPGRRPAWRPVAVAGALAVAVSVGVAVAPGGQDGTPSVLERAAAAVSEPGTILHYVATSTWKGAEPRRIESWQSSDGRRERTIFDGKLESAEDHDARTFVSYDPDRDQILRHTDPDYFAPAGAPRPEGIAGGFTLFSQTQLGDVSDLLRRAADGDAGLEVLPPSTVDGRPVDRVRITRELRLADFDAPGAAADPTHARSRLATTTREIALDRETALPVKVVDRLDGEVRQTTVYTSIEVLPRTTETERLLELAEHPGAKTRTEGPVG